MKILMLGTLAKGGIHSVIESYLDSETLRTFQIKFIPTHIEHHFIVKYSYFLLSIIKSIPCLLNPDYRIVHLHLTKHGSIMRKCAFILLSKIFFKKTVLHMHGADFFEAYADYSPLFKKLIIQLFKQADSIIVLSERRKREYSQLASLEKITVIPNFVDLPKERKRSAGTNGPKIISLGRLGERKGTGDLILALKRIENLPYSAELAGDGELEPYKKSVSELHLDPRVKIKGWVNDEGKKRLLEEADIFALPSYHEDLPVAILEAMAYSLPVVSTTVAGIPELVDDGESGFLVNPGDIDALADRLSRLVESPGLRRAMGDKGRSIIEGRFDRKKIEAKIVSLYRDLADD